MTNHILLPLGILAASLIVGLILQKWVSTHLHAAALKTRWHWDDVIVKALQRSPLIFCLWLGAYGVLLTGDLAEEIHGLASSALITVLILACTALVARAVGGIIEMLAGRDSSRLPSTSLFVNGTRLLVYIIGVFIILQNLDINITPALTALGIGGLAVALALEDTLNNLFCGIQIIAARQIRTGDYIMLETGQAGYVTDVRARNTTIRSFPDENRVIVPNSIMASSIITNFSLPQKQLWVTIPVGVSYGSDLNHVERVSIEVAQDVLANVEGGMPEHEPIMRYTTFNDSSIDFDIRIFVKEFRDQFLVRHEFIKKLHARYDAEGIEIPFPIRTVHIKRDAGE